MQELYEIRFPNGKKYIGISTDARRRFVAHKQRARRGSMLPVHCAIRKYGELNIAHRVLCVGERDYIAALEIRAIEAFGTCDNTKGYNITLGGDLSPMRSLAVCKKVSATKKITCNTEAFRAEISRRTKGRKASPEARENMRRAHIGKKMPEAQRLAMVGKPAYNKGWKATPSQIEKNCAATLARHAARRARGEIIVISAVTRAKISAALMGHPGAFKGAKRPEMSVFFSSTRWITDGKTNRRVPKESELPNGWRYGRRKNIKKRSGSVVGVEIAA